MIAIDIKDLAFLKLLQPICEYFIKNNIQYHVYHCDKNRGYKNYNNASLQNINIAHSEIIKNSIRTRAYTNDAQLLNLILKNNIKKLVSVEIFLCHPGIIKALNTNNIKTYSLLYLTDAMWTFGKGAFENITKTYFGSEFLMEKILKFSGAKYDPNKHKCLGTPLFDQLKGVKKGSDVLVLLPNLREEHVPSAFGNKNNFINIIKSLASKRELIFKSRQKQWLPNEIKQYAKEIIMDGNKMYPSSIVGAFDKCDTVVMFFSSGLYESVMANKYVVNVKVPFGRWPWDKKKMNEYFSTSEGSPYQYSGVVKSIEQADISKLTLSCDLNNEKRKEWLNKFLKPISFSSAIDISKDILKD